MIKLLNLLLLVFFVNVYFAQNNISPKKLGFEHYSINLEDDTINYYLTNSEKKLPLLVYLDGSGSFPLFQQMKQGIGSTVVIDFQNLQNQYQILLISKPSIPFIDSVNFGENGFPEYKTPKKYNEKLSLFWRVNSADTIINYLVKNDKVDSSKIVVLGFSEGAQVGPYLAQKNKFVSHLMLFAGNGLNQFFDPIITARMNAQKGVITEIEAQEQIDSLFNDYKEIYSKPKSTDKMWWGHTYLRWASFTKTDPYTVLRNLNIPIYIANGSLDENSVLSADYIALEFIRLNKNNLTYKTYPGLDHQFNKPIYENNQIVNAEPQLKIVLENAFSWLKSK